jgi:hypothetical protein
VRGQSEENGYRVEQTVKSKLIKLFAQDFNSFWLKYFDLFNAWMEDENRSGASNVMI